MSQLPNVALPLSAATLDPAKWIADLKRPEWDAYFMAMAFLVAMRSPDQETKQGCVIVDWHTKVVLGTGYNGHPRGSLDYTDPPMLPLRYYENNPRFHRSAHTTSLPTTRPDKYFCMVHADSNAAINCTGTSDHAVVYLPMPPCEVCLGILANMPHIKVRRIVYLEDRAFGNTQRLLNHLPHITLEKFRGQTPDATLTVAATYAYLRANSGQELSQGSTKTYTGTGAQP